MSTKKKGGVLEKLVDTTISCCATVTIAVLRYPLSRADEASAAVSVVWVRENADGV